MDNNPETQESQESKESKESKESQDSRPVVLETTDVEEGYSHMNLATRMSNTFPIGSSYNMFQTYPDFNAVTAKLRSNALSLSLCIISQELPTKKLRLDDNESNTDTAIEAIDALHDRINMNLDTLTGVNQPAAGSSMIVTQITTVTTSQVVLMASKNVPRPQIMFEDTIDNSENPFVPKIKTKHNAIVPLNLIKLYNDAGNFTGYAHPYAPELSVYEPPEWALRAEEQLSPPAPLEATPLTLVTTAAQLNDLVEHLRTVRELAVDVEHHAYRTYLGLTCLIQISTDVGGDFIVDALALRRDLHVLNEIFTDPTKVKVFHGADQDVRWLQRDLGVYVVGLFDSHQAARLLQLPGLGLKHLLAYYCNLQLDKQFQTADWRIRPLPDELVQYARSDTHYLLYAWRRLRADLLARQPPLLRAAFCSSNVVATTVYQKPKPGDDKEQFYARSYKRLLGPQQEALRALWEWRDAHARTLDESPAYLMPHHQLLALAAAGPRDAPGVRALLQPPSPFLRDQQRIIEICQIIQQSAQAAVRAQVEAARAIQLPPPMPPRNSIEHDHAYLSRFSEAEPQPGCSSWVDQPPWRAGPTGHAWVPPRVFMLPATTNPAPGPAPRRNRSPRNRRDEVESAFLPPYERYRAYRRLAAPAPPPPVAVAPDSS